MRGEMQILESDYVAFQRLYFRRHAARLAIFVGLLLAVVGVLWLTGALPTPIAAGAVSGAIGSPLAIWGLSRFVFIPRRVRRLYRESAALQETIAITCDEQAVHFDQNSGSWQLTWATAARWDENETIFAIYPNRAMAHILPKRDLAPELIDFARTQLIASGLPKPWKLRK